MDGPKLDMAREATRLQRYLVLSSIAQRHATSWLLLWSSLFRAVPDGSRALFTLIASTNTERDNGPEQQKTKEQSLHAVMSFA